MKSSTGSFLIGLLSGAAIGATLGILFAPDKGEVTRKKISNKANELKDDLEHKFNDLKEYVAEAVGHEKAGKKEKTA